MTIYIDTDSFPANARLYADAEKTKTLPRIIPAVQLTEGSLQIGFLGDYTPYDGSTLSLAASIQGTQTQVLASNGSPVDGASVPTWEFVFALNSAELAEAIEKRGNATLSFGVIASATGYRQEWQFLALCTPTSTGELDPEQVESAKDYAEQARQAADDAEQSKQAAATSASNAQTAATNAATSANNAASSASAANASAGNASTSATNAANSASAADTSANNAAGSATAAAGSAKNAAASAEQAAETLENVYTKPEIDGVDTGAEVMPKMNEIIAQLKEYEATTGKTLSWEFWEAVMAEFQNWQTNPSTKNWNTTSETASNNPWFNAEPQAPVIAFNVTSASGYYSSKFSFGKRNTHPIFLSGCTSISSAFLSNLNTITSDIIAPDAKSVSRVIQNAQNFTGTLYSPKATNWLCAAQGALLFNSPVTSANGTSFYMAFYTAYRYNQPTPMNSADEAGLAFYQTAMSPANIAATLDTLPAKTDGKSRTILFSRRDGTLLAPLMAESPYVESVNAATAKGWTVQFD